MLKAYFDDSGTHDASDVIVMGGVIADEAEWTALESPWIAFRDELKISKMHMSHCENGWKDFREWSRLQRDRAIDGFRNILVKRDALMLASAISKADWCQAINRAPVIKEVWEEPIDFCFHVCMHHALTWRAKYEDEQAIVIIDGREQSAPTWGRAAKALKNAWPSRIADVTFGSMERVVQLQAADMVAYEIFRHECDRNRLGTEPKALRNNFKMLIEALPLEGGYITADQLVNYVTVCARESRERRLSGLGLSAPISVADYPS